ncbi:MAG TPA: hypothetical protein VEH57_00905 [Thermoplasmata archaeon]|nr:hypothetical protein [Thermoplasmata archaeon]
MIRDGQIVCDRCQKTITRVTSVPAEGWERMHNLCSECFHAVWQQSIPRA